MPTADSPTIQPPATIERRQLARLVQGMRQRDGIIEMGAQAAAPDSGGTAENYRSLWGLGGMAAPATRTVAARCRQLYGANDLVGWYVDTLVAACNDGFRVGIENADGSENPEMRKWLEEGQGSQFDFAALARDVFLERILCSNAALFWRQPDIGKLPSVTVLNTEDCEWLNSFGVSMLTVSMAARTLTRAQQDALGPRYAGAYEGRPLEVVNGEHGEYFRVITGQKNGAGFRLPRLYQIFLDLSIRDLLRNGDWNAAWMLQNIIRLVRRGHEIKAGPLQGQDIHFLKGKEAKKIKAGLAVNKGTFDMVTNFDLTVTYSHLDPKYLSTDKYQGVTERLNQWFGPLGRMLEQRGAADPDTVKALEVQCMDLRGEVSRLFARMLNHQDFLSGIKPPLPIQVTWSGNTFTSLKLIMERVRLAQSAGISSTRTAREDLGYDHARESARLQAKHKDPQAVTPAFEQKQGMAGNGKNAAGAGGRPAAADPSPTPT